MDNKGWFNNELYLAFSGHDRDLECYLENSTNKKIRDDFNSMVSAMLNIKEADLKSFTKAAMQGLLSQNDIRKICEVGERLKTDYVGAIAKMAIEIAQATLSELQKQQS